MMPVHFFISRMQISLRKKIMIFFYDEIHPVHLSRSRYNSHGLVHLALVAKYTLELFANVGTAWFMTIINYSELIHADDGRLYFHVRAARLYRWSNNLYVRYFALRAARTARKLVGQVLRVWQKSIRRRENARSLRNERELRDRARS